MKSQNYHQVRRGDLHQEELSSNINNTLCLPNKH